MGTAADVETRVDGLGERTSSHCIVRKRKDAMSRCGKILWPEDARQPYPLELALWSRIDCPWDAAGIDR